MFIYFDLERKEKKEEKVKPIQCEHFVPRPSEGWSCHNHKKRARCRRGEPLYGMTRIDGVEQWLCLQCSGEAVIAKTHKATSEIVKEEHGWFKL